MNEFHTIKMGFECISVHWSNLSSTIGFRDFFVFKLGISFYEITQIILLQLVGWLVVLRINVDLAIFQPYLDLEAG